MAAIGRGRRSGGTGDNPFTERGFVLAGAAVAVVVVAGAAVLVMGPPDPAASQATPSDGTTRTSVPLDTPGTVPDDAAAQPGGVPGAAGSCPQLPSSDAELPSSAPADAEWRTTDEVPLPYSPTAGPAIVTDMFARCYAHTPTGAVLAAIQTSRRYRAEPNWGAVAQFLLAPGPGRDAYIRQRTDRTGPNATPGLPENPEDRAVVAGFRVPEHTADRVLVDVVTARLLGDAGTHSVWTMVWRDGDWKLELPADGAPPPQTPVRDGDPFVPWTPAGGGADPAYPTTG